MAVERVYTFPLVSELELDTRIPAARRTASEPPANLSWTPSQLIGLLEANGFIVLPQPSTTYIDDAAAATAGVAVGEPYWLAPLNSYGTPTPPGGLLTRRSS